MSKNLLQFASHFSAAGCDLDLDSKTGTMFVTKTPPKLRPVVNRALGEISKFEDARGLIDGSSALLFATTLDSDPNPLLESFRIRFLETLGILNDGKFVVQELVQSLNNHSWHVSEVPFTCTYFGNICTHRGIQRDPTKKGRATKRNPEEFHGIDAKGRIKREQLVTPALRELFEHIPASSLTRERSGQVNTDLELTMREYSKLSVGERLEHLRQIGVW